MKNLIISPHLDDEVLGCGGVILKKLSQGEEVMVCFVANRVYQHKLDIDLYEKEKRCALKTKEILGYQHHYFLSLPDECLDQNLQNVIIGLEEVIDNFNPNSVYVPFYGDNNQDHRAVYEAARVALRPAARPNVNEVYLYEVPSSTEQSPQTIKDVFMPNTYEEIGDYLEIKLKGFKAYETESRVFPHPRSLEAIKNLAMRRGIESNLNYAEAFMAIRLRNKL